MRLIHELEAAKSPGRILPLFTFTGNIWRSTTTPEGQDQQLIREKMETILVAAENIWEAQYYLHTHLPAFVPDKINFYSDIWLAPKQEATDVTS